MLDLSSFEAMTIDHALCHYGWGVELEPNSTVYRREIGDVVVWIGKIDEDAPWNMSRMGWECDIEIGAGCIYEEGVGEYAHGFGSTPSGALLNALHEEV